MDDFIKLIKEIEWPEELAFIGSGQSKVPSHVLDIPNIRTNSRTLEKYPNNVFAIMTWYTKSLEGAEGVKQSILKSVCSVPNYIFVFDQKNRMNCVCDVNEVKDNKFYTWYYVPVRDRYNKECFKDYVRLSREFGYEPRNSTGFYLILWLLYADVKKVHIAGYDGWMALSGKEKGEWKTDKKYYDCNGRLWCPDDYKEIETGNYYLHNLYVEWLAIKEAVKKARDRGVEVEIYEQV